MVYNGGCLNRLLESLSGQLRYPGFGAINMPEPRITLRNSSRMHQGSAAEEYLCDLRRFSSDDVENIRTRIPENELEMYASKLPRLVVEIYFGGRTCD